MVWSSRTHTHGPVLAQGPRASDPDQDRLWQGGPRGLCSQRDGWQWEHLTLRPLEPEAPGRRPDKQVFLSTWYLPGTLLEAADPGRGKANRYTCPTGVLSLHSDSQGSTSALHRRDSRTQGQGTCLNPHSQCTVESETPRPHHPHKQGGHTMPRETGETRSAALGAGTRREHPCWAVLGARPGLGGSRRGQGPTAQEGGEQETRWPGP